MDIDDAKSRSNWLRRGSPALAPVLVNATAALLMLAAVLLPPFSMSYLYPTTLCLLASIAGITDPKVGASGLELALPGAAVAGWNLLRLSRFLENH
jgi:hypothetical protein